MTADPGADRPAAVPWLPAAPGVPVLMCRAGGLELCFDTASVLEVRPGAEPAPLPGLRPPVLGLAVVRAAAVPVFDLAVALGLPAAPAPGRAALVVLRDGPRWAGARVDAVGEVISMPAAGWRPGAGWPGLTVPGMLRGRAQRGAQPLWLLDATVLLRAPSTGLVAAAPGG